MDFTSPEEYIASPFDSSFKKDCALETLSNINVSNFAATLNVSRKFLYAQKDKALTAVNDIFAEKKGDDKVLYTIPVTKNWLKSTVLSLGLHCNSTYRGIKLFFDDMLDFNISDGKIYDILLEAKINAIDANDIKSLANINWQPQRLIYFKQLRSYYGRQISKTEK